MNHTHFSGANNKGLMIGQNYGIVHNTFENEDDLRHRIIDWLSPPESSPFFRQALDLHHPGTGLWLARDHKHQLWEDGNGHFLWLHGIPGCGKSVLAATIIEDLRQQALWTPHAPSAVAYFFFTFRDTRLQKPDGMLRLLITQLASQHNVCPAALQSL
jgi:hypothetical protein